MDPRYGTQQGPNAETSSRSALENECTGIFGIEEDTIDSALNANAGLFATTAGPGEPPHKTL